MSLFQDIENIKDEITGALKIGSDQVTLSQKELLLFGILRLILGSTGGSGEGSINNEALALAIANALELKTLTVTGDAINEAVLAAAIAANTQPVSVSSLPLPTGAATSAKQAAAGTAGTPSTDVLSIQGVANGIAINVFQTSNTATASISFVGATTSGAFTIVNRLALIIIPIIASAPTLTLQVSLNGGSTWGSTTVVVTASASAATVIESDMLARVSGAIGLANAFRFSSSASITTTLSMRSVVQ